MISHRKNDDVYFKVQGTQLKMLLRLNFLPHPDSFYSNPAGVDRACQRNCQKCSVLLEFIQSKNCYLVKRK